MEQTFAFSGWFFTRVLSLIYLIAFITLMIQGRGLWGTRGVLPMAPYMKSVEQSFGTGRLMAMPSLFWLSTSDDFIYGAAITGAVFAFSALVGFAQGWCLLMCWALYLSFCSSGQGFMAFQWDSLLVEVGFLALFTVPWNFDFSLHLAKEPHGFVRFMFYLVLFKLMFLSGVVKLMSGDEAWRDLTALKYHYFTQPLPNPLAAFMNALPEWIHQVSTVMTFIVELGLPFLIFWPRSRPIAASGFILLSLLIMTTGNYAFFNWLTLALCLWLIPDGFWQRGLEWLPIKPELIAAEMFPHPAVSVMMGILGLCTLMWCVRPALPDVVLEALSPLIETLQTFRISNSYGLFAVMTKERPEIVIEGSDDGEHWKEYEFKYKPGPLSRPPPVVAPYHPRLDWQMWFAALGSLRSNPWVETLLRRILENSPEVLEFFSDNPFPSAPPKFVRARLYNYEFASVGEIMNNDLWWSRKFVREYTPTYSR